MSLELERDAFFGPNLDKLEDLLGGQTEQNLQLTTLLSWIIIVIFLQCSREPQTRNYGRPLDFIQSGILVANSTASMADVRSSYGGNG